MKSNYIPPVPGQIKDDDDSRTNVLEALGIDDLEPMDIGSYNDGYHVPSVASLQIDGKQYSLNKVLRRVGQTLKETETLRQQVNGLLEGAQGHYGVCWDKVNSTCARLGDAAAFPTSTANFGHFGAVNTAYSNPFDSVYPWSGRKLCNIDLDAYAALQPGSSLTDCVKAWEDEPGFSYDDEAGVWVYTPEFWGKAWDKNGCRYFYVTGMEEEGYTHYPENIEGRWHGGIYSRGGKNVLLPKPGMPGKSIAMSTLHTYAKNYGATLDNIFSVDAASLLYLVEYADMNSQLALGNGVSSLYKQAETDKFTSDSSGSVVHVVKANAANCIPGAIMDIGTTNGGAQVGSFIVGSTANNADGVTLDVTLTTNGVTPANVQVTTANMWSIHGLMNTKDEAIGSMSGYIGTSGQSICYYRGEELFGSMFFYVLGCYREQNTAHVWVAHDAEEADAYDALNKAVHVDTGCVLPSTEGYVKDLALLPELGLNIPPICVEIGGSSSIPVGDYAYIPAASTVNTVLLLGGNAYNGTDAGRCYGNWNYTASNSGRNYGARPHLKTPPGGLLGGPQAP